ncbi:MAG: YraN family protein [Eggerthellaceae bacterium]|nr:YraN family protein [Eggerthellaceae bacterium]
MEVMEKEATRPRTRPSRNRDLGRRGEDAAAAFLHRRGYDIVERNWTCYAGEADIIARDGDTLVFVEVKTRRGVSRGFPAEAVDAAKRERYERIALAYVGERRLEDLVLRFDVVSIVAVTSDRAVIRHHINAFGSA